MPPRGVPVLLYHSIDGSKSSSSVAPATFALQMAYLKRACWNTITVDVLLESIRRGQLPKKCVVITFDDGFRNALTEALPVLGKLGFTATVFAATGFIGGRNTYIKRAMPEQQMLSWHELRMLASAGWQIESHGQTHTDLPLLAHEQVLSELVNSRAEIERLVGVRPSHFCYPRGKYTQPIVDSVCKIGYRSAMSLRAGLVTKKSNPWLLERLWVVDTSLLHFRALLTQPYSWFARLRRRMFQTTY